MYYVGEERKILFAIRRFQKLPYLRLLNEQENDK